MRRFWVGTGPRLREYWFLGIDGFVDVGGYGELFEFVIAQDVAVSYVVYGFPCIFSWLIGGPVNLVQRFADRCVDVLGGLLLKISYDAIYHERVQFFFLVVVTRAVLPCCVNLLSVSLFLFVPFNVFVILISVFVGFSSLLVRLSASFPVGFPSFDCVLAFLVLVAMVLVDSPTQS